MSRAAPGRRSLLRRRHDLVQVSLQDAVLVRGHIERLRLEAGPRQLQRHDLIALHQPHHTRGRPKDLRTEHDSGRRRVRDDRQRHLDGRRLQCHLGDSVFLEPYRSLLDLGFAQLSRGGCSLVVVLSNYRGLHGARLTDRLRLEHATCDEPGHDGRGRERRGRGRVTDAAASRRDRGRLPRSRQRGELRPRPKVRRRRQGRRRLLRGARERLRQRLHRALGVREGALQVDPVAQIHRRILAQPAQAGHQSTGTARPIVRALCQARDHQLTELRHDPLGHALRQPGRHLGDVRLHQREGRRAAERWLPSDHLVHDRAQRIDVGPHVDGVTQHALGRHVGRRPSDHAGLGHGHALGQRGCPRDAEVQHLHVAVAVGPGRQEDVLGLEIPVDDALLVSLSQRRTDLPDDVERVRHGHRPARLEPRPEVLALQVLHGDEEDALVGLPEVVDRDGVRTRQPARRLGLQHEPTHGQLVRGHLALEHLESHDPVHAELPGLVDRAHASGADESLDPEPPGHDAPDQVVVAKREVLKQ